VNAIAYATLKGFEPKTYALYKSTFTYLLYLRKYFLHSVHELVTFGVICSKVMIIDTTEPTHRRFAVVCCLVVELIVITLQLSLGSMESECLSPLLVSSAKASVQNR